VSVDNSQRVERLLERFHEEASFDRGHDLSLLFKLWPFVAKHRFWFGFAMAVVGITAGASLVTPLIMRNAIDEGVMAGNLDVLVRGGLLLAAVVVTEQLLAFIQIYSLQVVGARAMADLRAHVFQFVHRLRVGFFDNQPVGRCYVRRPNTAAAVAFAPRRRPTARGSPPCPCPSKTMR
jgi:ATP-binding cassette subfamily B protein